MLSAHVVSHHLRTPLLLGVLLSKALRVVSFCLEQLLEVGLAVIFSCLV